MAPEVPSLLSPPLSIPAGKIGMGQRGNFPLIISIFTFSSFISTFISFFSLLRRDKQFPWISTPLPCGDSTQHIPKFPLILDSKPNFPKCGERDVIDADPRRRHRSIPTFIPLMGFFIPIPGHLWIGISSGMWDTPEGQPCASTAVVTKDKTQQGTARCPRWHRWRDSPQRLNLFPKFP